MANTYVLGVSLGDDETRLDALKQAIEDHDSPELLRVTPFGIAEESGLWVRTNLVSATEVAKARADGRTYRDDRSTLEWVWVPDENPALEMLVKLSRRNAIVPAMAQAVERELERYGKAVRLA